MGLWGYRDLCYVRQLHIVRVFLAEGVLLYINGDGYDVIFARIGNFQPPITDRRVFAPTTWLGNRGLWRDDKKVRPTRDVKPAVVTHTQWKRLHQGRAMADVYIVINACP